MATRSRKKNNKARRSALLAVLIALGLFAAWLFVIHSGERHEEVKSVQVPTEEVAPSDTASQDQGIGVASPEQGIDADQSAVTPKAKEAVVGKTIHVDHRRKRTKCSD